MNRDYPCKLSSSLKHEWIYLGLIVREGAVYKIYECNKCEEAVYERVNFKEEKKVIRR